MTATAQNSQQTTATPDRSGKNLVSARKVNDTTIEFVNNQKQRITLDFYGNGIFRLYLDPAGRAPHNPEATPAADILVENPRRGVKSLDLKGDANRSPLLASTMMARTSHLPIMTVNTSMEVVCKMVVSRIVDK